MFNFTTQLNMEDSEARAEAFMDAFYEEFQSDDEPYEKKFRQMGVALENRNPVSMLLALCGWSAESIACKALLIPDEHQIFHSEQLKGELTCTWEDGTETTCICNVDPTTLEVIADPKEFLRNGKAPEEVWVFFTPCGSGYSFRCYEQNVKEAMQTFGLYWYRISDAVNAAL